jgi:outer membrane protein assembly factor BamB
MAGRVKWTRSRLAGAMLIPLMLVLSGCDWTMFGFDATHSGHNAAEVRIGTSNVGSLVEVGSTAATDEVVSSSPTIANDILYVTSSNPDGGTLSAYAANGSANCSRSIPKTCRPLWTAHPHGSHKFTNSSPAVDAGEGVVYVGGTDGVLYAYDANGNTNCTTGSPRVCSPLWRSDPMGGSIQSSPTLANGYVYVATLYGGMYMFDETNGYDGNNPSCRTTMTGRICHWEWGVSAPGSMFSTPAVANGLVYIAAAASGGRGGLYAFDATTDSSPNCSGTAYVDKTCNPQWQAYWGGGGSSPAIYHGVVYIGSLDDGLLAFAADGSTNCVGTPYAGRTCNPLWAGDTGHQNGSSPTIANGLVYIGGHDGNLYAFNAANGSPLWAVSSGGPITSSATVANGVAYVGCSDQDPNIVCPGNLYAFNAATGTELWTGATSPSDGSIDASPTVANGVVYVGSGHRVYMFALP